MQCAHEEFLDWHGYGMSAMEMSHRTDKFMSMAIRMEQDFRQLLAIPDNYKLLFLQGGATSQFAMVPLNLLAGRKTADYIRTGIWSDKATEEAQRFCTVNVVTRLNRRNNHIVIPPPETWSLNKNAAYVYYTDNETVNGVQFNTIPDVGEIPLVSDMTSSLLSAPVDISRYGVIFASAQKNIGLSGLVVVIVRDDLIGHAPESIPSLYDYKVHVDNHSMFNTPATYSWYMSALVLQWVKKQGGLQYMEEASLLRSGKLYQFIDSSGFYNNSVAAEFRSRVNVPFTLAADAFNEQFIREASEHGLLALKGHRSVGGMRASMYNSMPAEAVDSLIAFMKSFEQRNV